MGTVVWDGGQSSEIAIHGIVQVITVSCFCDMCTSRFQKSSSMYVIHSMLKVVYS